MSPTEPPVETRLRVDPLAQRTIQRLVDGPAEIHTRMTELDDATLTLEGEERDLARVEERALELALADPANTNDAKRKAAVKAFLATDVDAVHVRGRVEAARIAHRRATRNLVLAQNEFNAARSLALIVGVSP